MYGIKGEGMHFKSWLNRYANSTLPNAIKISPSYYIFTNTHPLDSINKMLIRNGFQCFDVNEAGAVNFKDWSIPFKYTLVHDTLGEFLFTGSLFYGDYKLTKK